MQSGSANLEKKAIKLALHQNWEEAISVNKELLELNPRDIKTKIRLGKAYLETKDFKSAAKLFDEVLKQDPINQIAKKNYELAKNKKNAATKSTTSKSFVKEPGRTAELTLDIEEKGVTANSFTQGDELEIKVLTNNVYLKNNKTNIAEIKSLPIVKGLRKANKLDAKVSAIFLKGEDKKITVMIKSSESVFKGEKQEVKPYLKKGTIDEPNDMVIESYDDE